MKLKKSSLFGAIVLCGVFCFTSCDLLSDSITSKNLDFSAYNGGYIMKLNTSDYDLSGSSIGSISDNSSRSVEVSSSESASDSSDVSTSCCNVESSYISELNKTAYNLLNSNSARAVSSSGSYSYEPQNNDYEKGKEKNFYYTSEDSKGKTCIKKADAVLKTYGTHCNVWFIDNARPFVKASDLDFEALADTFDKIYDKETEICGTNLYTTSVWNNVINPVKKIDIVVADIYEPASETLSSGTYGYNTLYDMIDSDSDGEIYSNRTQAIYIDSYFYKTDSLSVISSLAHEFNHLLNFCQKTIINGININETWYAEMLSTVIEDYFRQFIDIELSGAPFQRLSTFTASYNYGFENWRSSSNSLLLTSYANAYAFGAYLVRNFGGIELFEEMAKNNFSGEESVTKALAKVTGNSSITFDYALKNFFYILLNTEYTTDEDVYSLNKVAGDPDDSDKLYFEALDITNPDGTGYAINMKNNPETLGAKGFCLYYVPSDVSSVTVTYPSDCVYISAVGIRK